MQGAYTIHIPDLAWHWTELEDCPNARKLLDPGVGFGHAESLRSQQNLSDNSASIETLHTQLLFVEVTSNLHARNLG